MGVNRNSGNAVVVVIEIRSSTGVDNAHSVVTGSAAWQALSGQTQEK